MARLLGGTARIPTSEQSGAAGNDHLRRDRPTSPTCSSGGSTSSTTPPTASSTARSRSPVQACWPTPCCPLPDSFVINDRQRASANGYLLPRPPSATTSSLQHISPNYEFVPKSAVTKYHNISPAQFRVDRNVTPGHDVPALHPVRRARDQEGRRDDQHPQGRRQRQRGRPGRRDRRPGQGDDRRPGQDDDRGEPRRGDHDHPAASTTGTTGAATDNASKVVSALNALAGGKAAATTPTVAAGSDNTTAAPAAAGSGTTATTINLTPFSSENIELSAPVVTAPVGHGAGGHGLRPRGDEHPGRLHLHEEGGHGQGEGQVEGVLQQPHRLGQEDLLTRQGRHGRNPEGRSTLRPGAPAGLRAFSKGRTRHVGPPDEALEIPKGRRTPWSTA